MENQCDMFSYFPAEEVKTTPCAYLLVVFELDIEPAGLDHPS